MFRVSYRRREKEGKRERWGEGEEVGRRRRWGGGGGGGGGMEEGYLSLPPSIPPSLPHLTLGLTADSRQLVWEALERERTPSTVLATGGARCAAVQV